jgi:hypothetical protein
MRPRSALFGRTPMKDTNPGGHNGRVGKDSGVKIRRPSLATQDDEQNISEGLFIVITCLSSDLSRTLSKNLQPGLIQSLQMSELRKEFKHAAVGLVSELQQANPIRQVPACAIPQPPSSTST